MELAGLSPKGGVAVCCSLVYSSRQKSCLGQLGGPLRVDE